MTAVIIEDEPLAALELEKILKKISPDIDVLFRLDSVKESVDWLRLNKVDLIFSDIHLGDGQSFDIFREVEVNVPVIFITAYDEYAIQAFKNQGIDYILKPFDKAELQKALDKVNAFTAAGRQHLRSGNDSVEFQERFLVHIGAKMKSVQVSDIAYFMADGKYLLLFTHDGANYIVDYTIAGIEFRLNPARFFRINRKFIVNFSAVKEMIKYSNSRIKLILSPLPPDNIESIVSADRIKEFKEWLDK